MHMADKVKLVRKERAVGVLYEAGKHRTELQTHVLYVSTQSYSLGGEAPHGAAPHDHAHARRAACAPID